jgi:hypothetical protein
MGSRCSLGGVMVAANEQQAVRDLRGNEQATIEKGD